MGFPLELIAVGVPPNVGVGALGAEKVGVVLGAEKPGADAVTAGAPKLGTGAAGAGAGSDKPPLLAPPSFSCVRP